MKLLFTFFLCSTTCLVFSQYWDGTKNLDTLLDKDGQILRIENRDNFDVLTFEYDSAGKLSKKTFTTIKNKIQYEKVTEYFSNGNLAREYFYYILDKKVYGKPQADSTYYEYYESGGIRTRGFFVKGKENGQTIRYYQNGNVETEMNYVDGKLMTIKCFDMNGNALDIGAFKDGNGTLVIYKDGVKKGSCEYKNGNLLKRSCKCNNKYTLNLFCACSVMSIE